MVKGILEFTKHKYTFTTYKKGNEKIYKITEQFGYGPKTTREVDEWEYRNMLNMLYMFFYPSPTLEINTKTIVLYE